MIEIILFAAIVGIVGVGIYLMRETDKFVEEQNRQIRLQQAYDRITKMSKQKNGLNKWSLNLISK